MRIALIGQKGIPAQWGGVESHVEELSKRLKKRGHEVSVYVRDWYTPKSIVEHEGIRLIHTPTINTKHLDAFVHSFTSSTHSIFSKFDIVHYHALGPSFFAWIPKIANKRIVVTIHRLDWQSGKWGRIARGFLMFCEKCALYFPQTTIVVSKTQREYFERKYNKKVVYIPNGVNILQPVPAQIITERYGLKGKDYILSMGRLVTEKRVEWIIEAYNNLYPQISDKDIKLIIAGGSAATDEYVDLLKEKAGGNERIVFTGYVKGKEKEELLSNAKAFIIPSSLEGLPIALLETMSYGLICLASDIEPHKEVIVDGVNGFLFNHNNPNDLKEALFRILSSSEADLCSIKINAKKHVEKEYNWDEVVERTEEVYQELVC